MIEERVDFVVLLGPPGAGKTHLGFLLHDRLGLDYRDVEREFVDRFGSREDSLARKGEALATTRYLVRDAATVGALRDAGATFRNDIVEGPGGKQVLAEDPSGNPIELFEPRG